jgi:4-hydroxybenzoate polyprenyltransferase
VIDRTNNIDRWSIRTRRDFFFFLTGLGAYSAVAVVTSYYVSFAVSIMLLIVAFAVAAYSIVLKKIFLFGNIVAAVLSITPGLIMFVDVRLNSQQPDFAAIEVATAFLAAGFLILVSREIKFDEFDRAGDRVGKRLTVPMIFHHTAVNVIHSLLTGSAVGLLMFAIIGLGTHSTSMNLLLGIVAATVCATLLLFAYRASSKTTFYKTTRLVMLVLPILIFAGF